jgi:hypothetical protein
MESRAYYLCYIFWASLAEDVVNERQSPSDPVVSSKCLRSMGRLLPISFPISEISPEGSRGRKMLRLVCQRFERLSG